MARTPHPDDCRATLTQLRQRRSEIDRAHAELERDLADAIRDARAARLHGAEIAELSGMSRTWLYRQYRDAMRSD